MGGIECALANPQGLPVVYLNEPSHLTLILTNSSGVDQTITSGCPVSEDLADGRITLLYLFLGTLVSDPAAVQVSCPGWSVQFQPNQTGAVWCLAPNANGVLKAGATLSVTLGHLTAAGTAGPRQVGIDAWSLYETSWAQQIPVAAQNDPGQVQPLDIDFSVNNGNVVYITEDTRSPTSCSVCFRLSNPSPSTPLVPETVSWGSTAPTFTLSFVYATQGTGAGALTSPERAAKFSSQTIQDYGNRWSITINTQGSPFWVLKPNQLTNKQILGIGAAASFEFLLGDIVTQLAPGTTLAYLQWTGIPGYQDGCKTVALVKTHPTPSILRFMNLSPSIVAQGTPVQLNWQTFALRSQTLSWVKDGTPYSVEVAASASCYMPDPQPDDTVTYSLDGIDHYGNKVPGLQVTVTVIADAPVISSFIAAPVLAPFDGQAPHVSITCSWTVTNAVSTMLNGRLATSPFTIGLNEPGDVTLTAIGHQGKMASATAPVYSVPGYLSFASVSTVPCGDCGPKLRDELEFDTSANTGTWTFAMVDSLAGHRVIASQAFTWTTKGMDVMLQFFDGSSVTLGCDYGTLTLTERHGQADSHGLMPLGMGIQSAPGRSKPVFTANL